MTTAAEILAEMDAARHPCAGPRCGYPIPINEDQCWWCRCAQEIEEERKRREEEARRTPRPYAMPAVTSIPLAPLPQCAAREVCGLDRVTW